MATQTAIKFKRENGNLKRNFGTNKSGNEEFLAEVIKHGGVKAEPP